MHHQKSLVSQGFNRLPFAKGKHRSGMRRKGEMSLLNNLYYYSPLFQDYYGDY